VKILVISDSHGHIANLKAVMEIAKKSGIKAVIHCGDWDNIKSIETVLSYGIPLYTIMGNADVEEGMEEYMRFNVKKFDPNFLKFELDGRKIGVVHNIKNLESGISNLDIVFSGHYHSAEEKMINFLKFVRPGAILNGINFVVYETANNEVEFVNET
jgi:putative phosphoesterase